MVSAWVSVKLCWPVAALVKLVAVFWKALLVSSEGSALELTVKYTVPPERLIGVLPSDCRKVRLTVLVSPRMTLLIVFPIFAIVYSGNSGDGDTELEGEAELEGLSEALELLEGLSDLETDAEGLREAEAEEDGDKLLEAEALGLSETEAEEDGETELEGLRDWLELGDTELEGLREGEAEELGEVERDTEALGDWLALGEGEAETLEAAEAAVTEAPGLSGRHIQLNKICPAEILPVATVRMMSSSVMTSGKLATVSAAKAAGEAINAL